jgi:hypothetical protein
LMDQVQHEGSKHIRAHTHSKMQKQFFDI